MQPASAAADAAQDAGRGSDVVDLEPAAGGDALALLAEVPLTAEEAGYVAAARRRTRCAASVVRLNFAR